MTSAKFWDFLTPSPLCPHLGLIYSTKFTQPPLLIFFLANPPPPSVRTSYMDAPLLCGDIQHSTAVRLLFHFQCLCYDERDCKHYVFNSAFGLCSLYETCDSSYDCNTCVIGDEDCWQELSNGEECPSRQGNTHR